MPSDSIDMPRQDSQSPEGLGPRVGVLLWEDARGPGALSGMPWNMTEGLRRAGCEVVPIGVGRLGRTPGAGARGIGRVVSAMHRVVEDLQRERTRRRFERAARASAGMAGRRAGELGVDAIFGPCMSRALAYIGGDLPVVYASDATASLLMTTYDRYRRRSVGWKDAMVDLESRSLARADRIALASDPAARSAVEDHRADPSRVSVVPLGANIEAVDHPVEGGPPSPSDLRLLLSAADPERKQLDLCVEIVAELRARGWSATLHYIGPERDACRRPEVEWAGRLALGDRADAAIHRELLRTCHLAILPSLAEMYGIAPIESAAFGRPAVVSNAGGLPTVVKDGETGRVVPVDTPVAGWADAVEAICARPDRYAAFSRAAKVRQASVLNWDAWGRTVRGLIEQVV